MSAATFDQFVKGVTQRLEQGTVRVQTASASLCVTVDYWTMAMTAKLEGKPLDDLSMRSALASEHILPRWKRQPHSYHTLASGEVVVFGKSDAHTVHTTYIRSQFNMADVNYLQLVVASSYVITAEHADVILRRLKPNTAHSKRAPAEADADPYLPQWRERQPRYLSPEDLIRSQFTGRALTRELRRIGK